MQRREIRTSSLLFLVVLAASALVAQTDGAMLYAKGNVALNGQSVANSTSIFAGDRLDIADSSVGSINRGGSSVVLSPNSSIQYQQSGVELLKGTARISTSQGMVAYSGSVTVTPKSGAAKFDVVKLDNNSVLVASREGALSVSDGSHTYLLQTGGNQVLATGSNPMDAGSHIQASKLSLSSQAATDPFYTVGQSYDGTNIPPCVSVRYCIKPHASQMKPCRCPIQ
jgi:hypothetical protein